MFDGTRQPGVLCFVFGHDDDGTASGALTRRPGECRYYIFRAILVSTHDEEFAREFATDILRLDDLQGQ